MRPPHPNIVFRVTVASCDPLAFSSAVILIASVSLLQLTLSVVVISGSWGSGATLPVLEFKLLCLLCFWAKFLDLLSCLLICKMEMMIVAVFWGYPAMGPLHLTHLVYASNGRPWPLLTWAFSQGCVCSEQPWRMRSCLPLGQRAGCLMLLL